MRVQKRDGSYQGLEITKIQRALLMAFQGSRERPDVIPMVNRVMDDVRSMPEPVSIERIGDTVERVLVGAGYPDVAHRFIRYRLERARVRASRLAAPDGVISEYIHVGKYARYLEEYGRRELFPETVSRDEEMMIRRWPSLEAEIRGAYAPVYQKEGMPVDAEYAVRGCCD